MNLFQNVIIPLFRQIISVDDSDAIVDRPLEILLVEDCLTDVDLVRDTFSEHRIHVATTFKEATTLIRELKIIDAAFVDLNIPGGHGMDLVNRITAKHPKCKIAATSGNASLLRPGDEGWIIMKHPRMAKSFKEFLSKRNGNGKVNYNRLFFIFLFFFIIIWIIGENKVVEDVVQLIKKL